MKISRREVRALGEPLCGINTTASVPVLQTGNAGSTPACRSRRRELYGCSTGLLIQRNGVRAPGGAPENVWAVRARRYSEGMRDARVFHEALRLIDSGQNARQVAMTLGVPWSTVSYWKAGHRQLSRATLGGGSLYDERRCQPNECPWLPPLDAAAYVYLLGLYLGDGTIQRVNRTAQLRIFLDDHYPAIQDECAAAIVRSTGASVSRFQGNGCTIILSYSLHWRCLFPQHGPGRKHTRKIELANWQQLLVDECPGRLLRGLIHSDGCRDRNIVKGREYPRYSFTNRSDDIHAIFRAAAAHMGLHYTVRPFVTSIARRRDVAVMDELVGAKR